MSWIDSWFVASLVMLTLQHCRDQCTSYSRHNSSLHNWSAKLPVHTGVSLSLLWFDPTLRQQPFSHCRRYIAKPPGHASSCEQPRTKKTTYVGESMSRSFAVSSYVHWFFVNLACSSWKKEKVMCALRVMLAILCQSRDIFTVTLNTSETSYCSAAFTSVNSGTWVIAHFRIFCCMEKSRSSRELRTVKC